VGVPNKDLESRHFSESRHPSESWDPVTLQGIEVIGFQLSLE
jgi:hypothetical protein